MIGPQPDRIWGWPWHGLATGGIIPGSDKAITQPSIGASWLIDLDLPAVSLTAEETADATANDYEWRNYALIAGSRLMDEALPANSYIHVDAADQCWLVTLSFGYVAENQIDITASIVRFGVFGLGVFTAIEKTASVNCEHIELTVNLGNPVTNYISREIHLEDVWTNGDRALVGVWLAFSGGVANGPADVFSVIEITLSGTGGATGAGLTLTASEVFEQSNLTYKIQNNGSAPQPSGEYALISGGTGNYRWQISSAGFCEGGAELHNAIAVSDNSQVIWHTPPFDETVIVGRHIENSYARHPYYNAAGVAKVLRLSVLDTQDHWPTGSSPPVISGSSHYQTCLTQAWQRDTTFTAEWSMTITGEKTLGFYLFSAETLIDKLEWVESRTGIQTSLANFPGPADPSFFLPIGYNRSTELIINTPGWVGSLAGPLTDTTAPNLASGGLIDAWRKRSYTPSGVMTINPGLSLGLQGINAHAAAFYLRDSTPGSSRTYGPVSTPLGIDSYGATSTDDIYFAWQRKTDDHAYSTTPICYV